MLEELAFNIRSETIEGNTLWFKITFEEPLLVSIGFLRDRLIATIVEGTFFAKSEDGIQI